MHIHAGQGARLWLQLEKKKVTQVEPLIYMHSNKRCLDLVQTLKTLSSGNINPNRRWHVALVCCAVFGIVLDCDGRNGW